MKQLLITASCAFALTLRAPAQSVQAAIDQLAALQTLGRTLQQGYKTISTGLNTIGSIRADEFGLHKAYITGLDTVQPAITTDQKLAALRSRLTQLRTQLQSALDYWK